MQDNISASERTANKPVTSIPIEKRAWHIPVLVGLLLVLAFLRMWNLGTVPPGMLVPELVNTQLSDQFRQGYISVIYDEVTPAREGLYYALLAASTTFTGRGLILWRLPSVWISMLTLATAFRFFKLLYGRRIALLAVGLLGVSFWSVWMSRAILHVTLMPFVTIIVGYTLSRAFLSEESTDSSMWFTFGGIALGLAQYVHVTAWVLIVLLLAFLIYQWLVDREGLTAKRGDIIYMFILIAVLALPLIIYTGRNPGVREPVPLAEQPGLITEIPERIALSLAGLVLRGDMLPDHNLPGKPILGVVTGVLLIVGIGISIARWRTARFGLALLWLIIGIVPVIFLPHKSDFEYMVVLQPMVFVFPALGLQGIYTFLCDNLRFVTRRQISVFFGVLAAVLIGTGAARTYRDYFLIWPTLGDVRLNYQADLGLLAHYLDTSDDTSPISICNTPVDKQDNLFALTNEELLTRYFMHRHDLPLRYFDCTQSLILAEAGASQRLIFPQSHYYDRLPGPLLAWMRYAHDEQIPGMRPDVVMRFDGGDVLADEAGAFITTAPTAWPPEIGEFRFAQLPVQFADNLEFLGYEVRDDILRPGEYVELIAYWRLNGAPPDNVTQFAHMLGSPVVVLAQNDSLGVQINTLNNSDIFLQYSRFQVPPAISAGQYSLSVGMYNIVTEQRLAAYENSTTLANRIYLQRVEIER